MKTNETDLDMYVCVCRRSTYCCGATAFLIQ